MSGEEKNLNTENPSIITQTLYFEYYHSLFEKIIENKTTLDYAQLAIVKDSRITIRSVSPYRKVQLNFLNGNQFYGDMNEECKLNGSGRYLWANDSSLYEGDFEQPNVIEGRGILKFKNYGLSSIGYSRYCGNFVDGKYHGMGQFTNYFFKYNGNFEDGFFHGKGYFNSGIEAFDGCFVKGKKVCGLRTYTNGTFSGEFDEKQMRKYGRYDFENGDSYCGYFCGGKFNGFGEYNWRAHKSTYIGYWRENKRHGLGKLIINGVVCITHFKDNIKNGPGVLLARDGRIYLSKYMFVNDEFRNCIHIDVNHKSIEILKQLFNIQCETAYGIPQFISCITYLEDKFPISATSMSKIYPFHLTFLDLNVRHEVIWNFAKGLSITVDKELEFSSIIQSIKELARPLEKIYRYYAKFSQQVLDRDESEILEMRKIGLWQFFIDLRLYEKDARYNIQTMIENAEKEFNLMTINSYDPFEVVPIAYFVYYVFYTVLHINRNHSLSISCAMRQKSKIFGIFATMFIIFMREFMPDMLKCQEQNEEENMRKFQGNLYDLLQDDKRFFLNFMNIIGSIIIVRRLTIRDLFIFISRLRESGKFNGNFYLLSFDCHLNTLLSFYNLAEKRIFEKMSRSEILECINERMPFFKKENFILETSHPLTLLELMELIIVLLKREISMEKFRQSMSVYEEKLKHEQENMRKTKKSIRIVPRKR